MMTADSGSEGLTRRSFLTHMGAAGIIVSMAPAATAGAQSAQADGTDPLERAFQNPADSSKAWACWWWLDGAVTKAGITADLESMQQQGISGVLIFDAGFGGPSAPKGPAFMSDEWRENFHYALTAAARLGLQVSVNLSSGWNAGGPWVTREDAIKHLVWQETVIEGPSDFDAELPRYIEKPPTETTGNMGSAQKPSSALAAPTDWYRDVAVLACVEAPGGVWKLSQIRDLSAQTNSGHLRWQVPAGSWRVLRMGYIVRQYDTENGDDSIRTKARSSQSPVSWEIDPMSGEAMDRHFAQTAGKLLEDAGTLAGTTLKYVHIDSWEIGLPNWTPRLIEEFTARRNYSPVPYLPGLAGKIIESPEITARFAWDYRRTIADLIAAHYYGRLTQLAHARGLQTDSESGGPWYTQYADGMECLGANDIPMGEFWSTKGTFSNLERKPSIYGLPTGFLTSAESDRPAANFGSLKQASATAHVYGQPICQAESFTSFNPDWTDDPDYLKPFGDRAFCLGVTRHVLQMSVAQPSLTDKPGSQWGHIGPHFDRNTTWWSRSHAWFMYFARCQYLLRQGSFCADLLYFSGQAIPNFPLLDRKPIAGYDFDFVNAQALLTRAGVQNGHITFPGGAKYRYLVIPEGAAEAVTPAVARKLKELVEAGVTLVGAPPRNSLGLTDYPGSQEEVTRLVNELWGGGGEISSGVKNVGVGRVISGRSLASVLQLDGVAPDVELRIVPRNLDLEWIHRRDQQLDIYFLANLTELETAIEVTFRVSGKAPELWDAVSGSRRALAEFRQENGRTTVPLRFAARQSWFVVFRKPLQPSRARRAIRNFPAMKQIAAVTGPWAVSFDEQWGGPKKVIFEQLDDWSQRPEPSIRYYSGTATYRNSFKFTRGSKKGLYLQLGKVRNLAQVRVNGHDAGVVWTAPWRVDISKFVRSGDNELEIDVVNLWPNRLIGDAELPEEQRYTKTNVRTYDRKLPAGFACWKDPECEERKKTGAPAKLLSSGLLGPVVLMSE